MVFVVAAVALVRVISGIPQARQRNTHARLPIATEQRLSFPEAGDVILNVEGPLGTMRFASAKFRLMAEGTGVELAVRALAAIGDSRGRSALSNGEIRYLAYRVTKTLEGKLDPKVIILLRVDEFRERLRTQLSRLRKGSDRHSRLPASVVVSDPCGGVLPASSERAGRRRPACCSRHRPREATYKEEA